MSREKKLDELRNAIETNNRINNAKKDIETLEAEIKDFDALSKLTMMSSAIKQIKIDGLKKELENAELIDIVPIMNQIMSE
jgi:uncharacterized protein YqeY